MGVRLRTTGQQAAKSRISEALGLRPRAYTELRYSIGARGKRGNPGTGPNWLAAPRRFRRRLRTRRFPRVPPPDKLPEPVGALLGRRFFLFFRFDGVQNANRGNPEKQRKRHPLDTYHNGVLWFGGMLLQLQSLICTSEISIINDLLRPLFCTAAIDINHIIPRSPLHTVPDIGG